jgi:signal transduction histidine kinase
VQNSNVNDGTNEDAARISRSPRIVNLLSNAIKYSDPDKAQRLVDAHRAAAPEGWFAFAIQDNGIGVPADQVEMIFSQFVRTHSERDEELAVRGLGLGLSIVRESLDAMGGTITMESLETKGTMFTIALPIAVPRP